MTAEKEKQYQEFKSVFEQYYTALGNFAYSYIKDRKASEDIVQEIFMRIWEKRPDLIGSSTIRFYLFTAVRNNCLTYLQHAKRIVPLQSVSLDQIELVLPSGITEVQPVDQMGMIQRALSLLPPKCKEVFLLSRIGHLSYKEIAKTMGISVKTVENQIGKAIRVLRNFLIDQKYFMLLLIPVIFQYINNGFIGDFMNCLLS